MPGPDSRRVAPIEIDTSYFTNAPKGVRFGVELSHQQGGPGGSCLPEANEAAIQLVYQSYSASGIIPDSPEQLKGLQRLDDRSERFVVVERLADNSASLFATARLIHRIEDGDYLPIEKLFPWYFGPDDTVDCVEISQVVSHHPSAFKSLSGFIALIRAAYGYVLLDKGSAPTKPLPDCEDNRRLKTDIEKFIARRPSFAAEGEPSCPEISRILFATEKRVFDAVHRLLGEEAVSLIGDSKPFTEARDEDTELFPVSISVAALKPLHELDPQKRITNFLQGIDYHSGMGYFGRGIVDSITGAEN